MKVCRSCEVEKPNESFYKSKDKGCGQGLSAMCRPCNSDYTREWRKKNPDRHKVHLEKTDKKDKSLWANYRMRIEEYKERLEFQNGVCSICEETCSSYPSLSVDHDHSCCSGKPSCGECTRALICNRCNIVLGKVQDNPKLLLAMAEYLERW